MVNGKIVTTTVRRLQTAAFSFMTFIGFALLLIGKDGLGDLVLQTPNSPQINKND